MAEYIEREAAKKAIYSGYTVLGLKEAGAFTIGDAFEIIIDNVSAADVAPVRHGRNIYNTVPEHCEFKCSLCGAELSTVYGGKNDFGMDGGYLKYCPNCGAKMDKEE